VKEKKRVGRGQASGTGKTAGRGGKGQKARTGKHELIGFEGGQMPIQRRQPKRGFTNPFRIEYALVNVGTLEGLGLTEVDLDKLVEVGAVKDRKGGLKVLGDGELTKAVSVAAHRFSGSAKEKIEKAGGKAEVIVVAAKVTPQPAQGRGKEGGRREEGTALESALSRRRRVVRQRLLEPVQDPGAPQAASVHPGLPRGVPHRRFVTAPGVNREVMKKAIESSGGFLNLFNLFTGGALEQLSIFALGIMPYVSAKHHPAAAHGSGAHPRKALQRGRDGAAQDHPVDALRHHRPLRRAGLRDRPLPRVGEGRQRERVPDDVKGWGFRLLTVITLTAGPPSSCGWASRSPSAASGTASR